MESGNCSARPHITTVLCSRHRGPKNQTKQSSSENGHWEVLHLRWPIRVITAFACSTCHWRALYLQFACSICSFACSICSSHALISIPRALFAVRTLYLQFACSTFSFACSICSSHALFSFSRALFAVRVLCFQFCDVSICSSRTLFSIRALHLQFACSNFHYSCSICSSSVLYLQHSCSGFLFTFSGCNSCVLIFSHFLLQLARSTEQSARYCFCTWLFVADCGTWIKLCVWSGFNMA